MCSVVSRWFLCLALLGVGWLQGEVRSIDGKGNNVRNPEWGSSKSQLQRFAGAYYSDGISSLAGADRPSPRMVSNIVAEQPTLTESQRGLSDMTWCWGQFLDHDITLVVSSRDEFAPIMVDDEDMMAPMIPLMRSASDPDTGTSTENPRQQMNSTTAFIDGSMVYGHTDERADALRSHVGGRLKMTADGLLPLNEAEIEMDNPNELPLAELYMAGDIRANENPALISIHTLWLREHNRWADDLAATHAEWTDEEIYQQARRMVIGQIQNITYQEFLPALLGSHAPGLDAHYDSEMNPSMFNEVAGALYRIGHSMVSSHIMRMKADGSVPMSGRFLFRDAFFQPTSINASSLVGEVLMGVAGKRMQEIDPFVVTDLRNFLFAQEGAGGLDLIAINLQRGRDHGLPSFNQAREALGLPTHQSFSTITSNTAVAKALEEAYGDVDQVDLWMGAMAEDHMAGTSTGETLMTALTMQFRHLRDGDRFYYLIDDALTPEEKATIRETTLADVIRRNTAMTSIQDQVFMAPPISKWMDSDHDGQPDIREVIAGTDPNNPSSRLQAGRLALSEDGNKISLQWQSVPGILYLVERVTTLDGAWETVGTTSITADSTTTSWTAPVTVDAAQEFYRVVVGQ